MKKIVTGILAHVDSGKTTLSEALLYCSGAINKLGRVDRKDSFLDTFSLERSRGITIFSKQAQLTYKGTRISLLDTPGHVDFSAETERTLQILDYTILVISGCDGVQSHTRTLWKLLEKYNVPCFIFVNKMDMDGADRYYINKELKQKLSDRCVDFGSKNMYEEIALCDEKLLDQYYENETIGRDDIISAVKNREIFPCMYGSALRVEGVREFFDVLSEYTVMPDYPEEFSAKVYKISRDSRDNRLTHLKVTGGRLKVRDIADSPKNKNDEKISQIRIYSGDKFDAVDEADAGTVCAVTGLSFTLPGDGLGAEKNSDSPILSPVLTYKVELPEDIDVHTALQKFRILESEDPQLNVIYNERLSQIQIRLMGEIQLEVLKSLIKDRFGFEVMFGAGNIIYKETIKNTVEGIGHFEPLRHYAEVHLVLKPLKRDSGLVFKRDCKEDVLDKNWQRLILTHLYEKTHIGVLTGSPITDMEISIVSGRAHAKHTEGGDFRQATYRAVRQGLRSAESVLLEPVYDFILEIPADSIGRAMTDIQRMYGSFNPPETEGENAVITGTAPVATMNGYAAELLKYTHGKGRLTTNLKGYEVCHNPDEVIEAIGYDPDSDVDNPCSSVFCSHGAGHNVSWDKVRDYMHLPSALNTTKTVEVEKPVIRDFSKFKSQEDIFAADKELTRIFEQTYGPIKKKTASEKRKKIRAAAPDDNKYKKPPQNLDGDEYILVDGYNVIFSWEHLRKLSEDNIDGARQALINILCNYQGYKKCEMILVFDAYKVKGSHREVEKVDDLSIVYTKEAETADMYIEKTSHKLAKNNRVRVVTSDALEQIIILGGGALRVSSRAFLEEVREAEDEIRSYIE
jgi:small GTP-binding protein